MNLVQSFNSHKKVYGLAAALILGASATWGITSAIKTQPKKQNEQEVVVTSSKWARIDASEELYRNNVLRADSIALADALKAYNEIKPIAQQKIEEAEHNLRVAQYNSTYKDMKKKEQELANVKNSDLVVEYNNLQKKIDSLEAVQKLDCMLLGGEGYYKYDGYNFARENHIKDYNSVDERYKDVTGRNLSDDIDSLLAK